MLAHLPLAHGVATRELEGGEQRAVQAGRSTDEVVSRGEHPCECVRVLRRLNKITSGHWVGGPWSGGGETTLKAFQYKGTPCQRKKDWS